jgi:predicted membrane GTPase involved in stress response
MRPLFEAILKHTPQPEVDVDKPLQMQICSLDYNSYIGQLGIGRIKRGRMKAGQEVAVMYGDENRGKAKVGQIMTFKGLERKQAESKPKPATSCWSRASSRSASASRSATRTASKACRRSRSTSRR